MLLVIPVYNNATTIADVVTRARLLLPDVLVVDDGSTDASAANAKTAGARVVAHTHNRGKGEALRTALALAHAEGFEQVLTLDGDGQHFPEDAPALLAAANDAHTLVLGQRSFETLPNANRFGNRFSNLWVNWAAGTRLADTQCGLRLYPADTAARFSLHAQGYAFETEALVKHARARSPVKAVPVRVAYPKERVSHFRPARDATRIVFTVMRFLFLPRWFW